MIFNFYTPDPIEQAIGIPSGTLVMIVLGIIMFTCFLTMLYLAKPEPPFSEEQEKRIKEIIKEVKE